MAPKFIKNVKKKDHFWDILLDVSDILTDFGAKHINKIPRKSQENAEAQDNRGIIPGEMFVYVFSCLLAFSGPKRELCWPHVCLKTQQLAR